MIDISIIIPTFNRLWSLPKAIASCRQPGCKIEIIVVDDGSTDGTWEWLQSQPGVLAIRQQNWGKDWAVNAGFACASGEFVKFIDSDDWILPNTLSNQVACGRAGSADVVVAGYELYDEFEHLLRSFPWVECDDFIAQQLGECDSSHYSAYLFRREFIKHIPHRQEFGARDDRMFVIETALAEPRVAVFPGVTLGHRQHGRERLQFPSGLRASVTNFKHLVLYQKALDHLRSSGRLTSRRKKAAANILWPLAHWIAYTHLEEACNTADLVFELDPDFQIPQRGMLGALYRNIGFRRTELLLAVRRAFVSPFRKRD